jgi:outer membrane protein OmpA-like peptidoglycan-associated protein/tetratricopeptide (TPR) repeat protein
MNVRLLLALLFAASAALAQPTADPKPKSPLKMAKDHLKFDEFNQALPYVKQLVERDPGSAYFNYWMGKCLYATYKKNQALAYFERAEQINPNVDREFHYWYAYTLHYNLQFDRAIVEYKKDLERYQPGSTNYILINNRIAQCMYGKRITMKKDAEQVKIANMGPKINSEFSEHSPVISANDTVLLYTARRPECLGADPESFFYDEDIYISHLRGGEWSQGINIDKPVNAPGHDATISLSADGKKLYLYRHKKAGGLYYTNFSESEKKWNEPKAVERPLNSKYYEASICQSADSSVMFFTSDRPGGFGGRDIYMIKKTGKNSWSEPRNLGSTVNTPFDEDAPYLHPDGKTLYYSSNGPNSIGGFDIFVTEMKQGGGWLPPLNMGLPVNTPDDDIYFVLSETGKSGYYTSGKEGGFGEKDIYHIIFPYYPYPRRYYIVELAGFVQDAQTLDTLPAMVKLIDPKTNQVLDSIFTNEDTSRFYFLLEPEREYIISVSSSGFISEEETIKAPPMGEDDILIEKIFLLDRPAVVKKEPDFQNIYYDFDQDSIRPDAIPELVRLADYLKANPETRVAIMAHTDWFGTYKYNVNLSLRRGTNAKKYLVDTLGVAADRITFDHFSENKPLEKNDDDTGRQFNRRAEFRIFVKDSLVFTTKKLREGVSEIFVDHTTPKGKPGYDNPKGLVLPGSSPEISSKPATELTGKEAIKESIVDDMTAKAVKALDLRHIYFDLGQNKPTDASKKHLDDVRVVLKAYPDLTLEIKAFHQIAGVEGREESFSDRRAYSVLEYLKNTGLEVKRMKVSGIVELRPNDEGQTDHKRPEFRRVELRIIQNGITVAESRP